MGVKHPAKEVAVQMGMFIDPVTVLDIWKIAVHQM